MKIKFISILFAAFLLSINSFGSEKTITKDVSSFDSITVKYPGTIKISQGDKESVTIRADEKFIDRISVEVNSDTLEITMKSEIPWYKKLWTFASPEQDAEFEISVKSLSSITIKGSDSIQMLTPLKAENFSLLVSGSGSFDSSEKIVTTGNFSIECDGSADISLSYLETKNLSLNILGRGNISIQNGKTDSQSIKISGSGTYNAPNFSSEVTSVTCSGSGTMYVNAIKRLDIDISGSGSVSYTGKPAELTQKILGSGNIKNINN